MVHQDRPSLRRLPRLGLPAVLAIALAPAPAHAVTPAALEEAFGGTIVSTYADGRHAKLWLDPDGGYRGQGRRGDPSSGHWAVKGDKLCLKQSTPMPVPFSYCTKLVTGGVGTVWTATSVFGEPLTVELAPGR